MLFDMEDNELLPEIDEWDHPDQISEQEAQDFLS